MSVDPKTFKVTLELTVEEVNIILEGLQELPAKTSNPLTNKIIKLAQDQLPKEDKDQK